MKEYLMKTVSVPGIGTLGTLYSPEGEIICRTVEREWLNNTPSVSCIPEGIYSVSWTASPRFGKKLALQSKQLSVSVAGNTVRTHILIHAANRPGELHGCIAPGVEFADNWFGVSNSRSAVSTVESMIGRDLHNSEEVFLKIVRAHAE